MLFSLELLLQSPMITSVPFFLFMDSLLLHHILDLRHKVWKILYVKARIIYS